ncbi:polysaccharide deacetylase family protein [Amycolatopsis alkalitolerans]|uniref:ChbG/HpnK family deacetylase n=1 Tax=Amycolatopsis alkalitolerans TaxID=2547244 RepID=A0A5C4LQT9_9PSEU|nr:polysaccharide deacetylase family protein [Amycolatopsis alkalitolerans]TNC21008.1 ChbG/HpnK family deacetylase [Amycolatopsis alkalitolerans]
MPAPSELNRRLGYAAGDRLLIVNADDFGMCRSANRGIHKLLAAGGISSATLMTPCAWAPAAASMAAAFDVGVHLVFTSEWERYRWGPVGAPGSLVDEAGYFPRDCASFERQAEPEHVRAEIEAQLAKAVALGLDPTHADNHMGSLYGLETGRDFLRLALDACARHGLPFRLPRIADLRGVTIAPEVASAAQHLVDERCAYADELGVVVPDYVWTYEFGSSPGDTYESVKQDMITLIKAVEPGVTEIYLHPFEVTGELREISPDYAKRGHELAMLQDPELHQAIADAGVARIGWRELRALQRGQGR